MSGEGLDAAGFGLREQRHVGEPLILEQRGERSGTAAEPERVNRQDGDGGIDVVPPVARGLIPSLERLSHHHPERVAGRDAVPAGEHELVGVGVLGPPIVEPQSAQLRAGEMHGDVVRGVCQRPAEMSCLRVVPEQHEGHARHEPHVFHPLAIVGRVQRLNGGHQCFARSSQILDLRDGPRECGPYETCM